jgi:hypothetical protein
MPARDPQDRLTISYGAHDDHIRRNAKEARLLREDVKGVVGEL